MERSIGCGYTYPKMTKRNAHAESFNRTLQDSFVEDHEDLFFIDPSSTASLPIGSSTTTPNAPAMPSPRNPRDPSSCSIRPSAKGTGPIHRLDSSEAAS